MANIDHIVKVASIIGLLQGGRWMKQYDSLFAVMNELGQVITWQFVWSILFNNTNFMNFFKEQTEGKRMHSKRNLHWRKKLQDTFRTDIQVKLDIFQAVQRTGLAMSKKHPFHWRCLKDFSQIFREDGDNGYERHKATPPEVIQQNLRGFLSK